MMAVAGLFASCQSNLEPVVVDEVVNVSLEVGTPEVATRAYSDGMTATKLQYAVYDADGNKLDVSTETVVMIQGKTTVDLQLTTGNTYKVLFWASEPDAPYTVDLDAKTMTVDYAEVLSNDENLDAFYKWETIEVTGPMSKTVQLKRPFAQLNVGTNDFEKAKETGYEPTQSYVKVTNIYNTLNLAGEKYENGLDVTGEVEVEFALNTIPTGETFPVENYDYLAMNYLLVGNDKEVVDVEFGYQADGEAEPRVRTVGSVPVQRNHRTNLYGQLLTSNVEINVEILPGFDDEYNNEHLYYYESGVYYIASAEGLAYVAQQVNAGNEDWTSANISLKADIDLAAVNTRSTSNWTPIGTEDYVFEGVFDGKGHTIKNLNLVYTEPSYFIGFFGTAENATIKNVTFENVYVNVASDDTNSGGHIAAVAGYADNTLFENITVKGDVKVESTFESNASSRVAVVLGGNLGKTVKMKNVHVKAEAGSYLKANNNVGSLAGQLLGTAVIEDCSSNIDVTAYKFFAGGIVGNTADKSTIKNCSYSGNAAVTNGRAGNINDLYRVGAIAGGWDDNVYTPFVLEGCTSTGTVSGKDAAGKVAVNFDCMGLVGRGYSAVAGAVVIIDGVKFTYAGGGKYDVVDANGNIVVMTEADLADVFTNGGNAILFGDLELNSVYTLASGKTLVLDLNGKNISSTSTATGANYNLFDVRGNLTVKNGTIEIEHTGTNMGWGNSTNVFNVTAGGVLNIVDAEVNNLGGSDMGFVAHLNNWGEVTLNVENSVLTSNYVAVRVFNSGNDMNNVTIKNTTLKGANYAFWVHNYTVADFGTQEKADAQKALLNFDIFGNGNTFIAAKSAVRLGFTNEIFVDENGVEFMPVSTPEQLSAALAAGQNVALTSDVEITKIDLTSVADDVVIDANGHKITTASNYGIEISAGKNVTVKNAEIVITVDGNYITYAAGIKINNGDYSGQTIAFENCELRMKNTDWAYAVNMPASVKNLNLVIDNCVFEGAIALQCWGDNNKITINGGEMICNYTTNENYTSYCVVLQGDGSYAAENNVLSISDTKFSYSGVNNYNKEIYSVSDVSHSNTNQIIVSNCTYEGVEAY